MRLFLALTLLPFPAAAWEFSATPICTLTHRDAGADVTVTYDASLPEYTLTVTHADTWPNDTIFVLGFEGNRPSRLTTDRHTLSDDGRSLTVKDRGFGNVLDGIEFNATGIAIVGETSVQFDLNDAAPAVQSFRNCPAVVTS